MKKIIFEVIQNDDDMEFRTHSDDPRCTLLGRFQCILKVFPLESLKLTNHITVEGLRITESQIIEIINDQFNPDAIQLDYKDNSTIPREPSFSDIFDAIR